jgi:hypothetical protein
MFWKRGTFFSKGLEKKFQNTTLLMLSRHSKFLKDNSLSRNQNCKNHKWQRMHAQNHKRRWSKAQLNKWDASISLNFINFPLHYHPAHQSIVCCSYVWATHTNTLLFRTECNKCLGAQSTSIWLEKLKTHIKTWWNFISKVISETYNRKGQDNTEYQVF